MSSLYEIPLQPQALVFNIILNTVEYILTFRWFDVPDLGGWFMDIQDSSANNIVTGIHLVSGVDLLYPYKSLNIGGEPGCIMLIMSDGGFPFTDPTYASLGVSSHLWFYAP